MTHSVLDALKNISSNYVARGGCAIYFPTHCSTCLDTTSTNSVKKVISHLHTSIPFKRDGRSTIIVLVWYNSANLYPRAMQERNGPAEPSVAVTSSLNSIRITPRTPKTPRLTMRDEDDDVELSLLNEEERLRSATDFEDDDSSIAESDSDVKKPISANDKRQMVLLCVLCECVILGSRTSLNGSARSSARHPGTLYQPSVF